MSEARRSERKALAKTLFLSCTKHFVSSIQWFWAPFLAPYPISYHFVMEKKPWNSSFLHALDLDSGVFSWTFFSCLTLPSLCNLYDFWDSLNGVNRVNALTNKHHSSRKWDTWKSVHNHLPSHIYCSVLKYANQSSHITESYENIAP